MEFVQNFTPPDFHAKNFTPPISPNFNSFSKNIARIANAVQVTICLLVSTSIYSCLLVSSSVY